MAATAMFTAAVLTTGADLLAGSLEGIPEVQLSSGHAALCRVSVGDEMPVPELPDLSGKRRDWKDLTGKKATVVVYWQGVGTCTRMLLADLGPDVLDRFGENGVGVVGISVGQDRATTEAQLAAAGAEFPVFLDADGAAAARVGNGRLPRVYVIDAESRVVWFDIEYSRATRRELRQTLEVLAK